MATKNLTIEILKSIRDEIHANSERLDGLTHGVDETNRRLDQFREEFVRRLVESETRTATALIELATTVKDMTQVLKASHDLRPRVEKCENDIAELKRSVG